MKAIRLAILEVRRFRGPWRRLVPLVLMLVPLLYGSLYLWSNWDPYGRAGEIPVAVVIEDQPVTALGEVVNAGEQFKEQLKAEPLFDWHFVDAADAHDGLVHGRYYFTIGVPPDFSSKLVSAQNPVPQRAEMTITMNDANNFIAGVVAETAKSELQNQVNSAAHAAYAQAIYGNLSTVKQQIQLAATGADKLVDASVLSQQGTAALSTGLRGLNAGSGQIAAGARQIAEAGAQADQAVTAVTDNAAAALPGAATTLVNAATAAEQSLGLVQAGADQLRAAADAGAANLTAFAGAHPELAADPALARAVTGAQSLAQQVDRADTTARTAHTAAVQALDGARALQANVAGAQQQLRTVATTVRTLTAGVQTVAEGTAQLQSAGLDSLAAGSQTLQTGADQLHSGATDLAGVAHNAVQKIPDTSPEQTAKAADVIGSPVGISTDNLNPATLYGRGLTPFFFAIALWVFGLFGYLLLTPVNRRAMAGKVSALTVAAAGWLPGAVLGAAGGLILYAAVQFGLGLDPVHPWWMAGTIAVAAASFVAIDHFLRTAFGVVGDMVSLVLLIVQLTTCGGLYPIETTPAPFRAINPYLPMTYLVDGLRVTVSGGLTSNLVRDVLVLAGFLVVFVGLSALAVQRQRTWTIARLHPQIEL